MISNIKQNSVYVWIWLPNETEPVVAGLIFQERDLVFFQYGNSYLKRSNAVSIYLPELPLISGIQTPKSGLSMPSCIRDASPDAWGRRVIVNRLVGLKSNNQDSSQISEITYLVESGSDRIGALDFQASSNVYEPRQTQTSSLPELMMSAEKIENGLLLTPELDAALIHGSSIGGARPKSFIDSHDKKYIAKFSSSTDVYSVLKAEFIAMKLAKVIGIDVADVTLVNVMKKDVLLIERFDRIKTVDGWVRKAMLSALTLLGLDELMARYASYEDLAEIIRHQFENPEQTLKELFSRLVYNILCGNTDDHARNHAAFWDGKSLKLTPSYDLCPQGRAGNEASQAMLIVGENRRSQLKTCLDAAKVFSLSQSEAATLIDHQIQTILHHWDDVCDEAQITKADRAVLWRRQFLNPYVFENSKWDHLDFS